MTGKSYNIREMKAIVDYLTENKLYGEIKGRKMWMDFANSQLTTRTWQSLKETFLKRILPDIHNPYYKLNMEQINSFRAGYDVGERNKNKLEIHAVSDDSNSNGPTQNETPQPNNGNGFKEENIAGENIKSSKIPSRSRSSADTVIVETCYETAEDIQKDLESPRPNEKIGETKSFRDCITYSEPLTPMLQEVLDDFQSEPENEPEASDRENQLETMTSEPATVYSDNVNQGDSKVEEECTKTNNAANSDSKKTAEPISVQESDKKEDNQLNDETGKKTQDVVSEVEKDSEVVCLDDSPVEDNDDSNDVEKNAEIATLNATKEQAPKNDEIPVTKDSENPETIEVPGSSQNSEVIPSSGGLNNSNNTTDASLPNNPEALKKKISNEHQTEKPVASENKTENKISRKRSNSEAVKITDNKKTKLERMKIKATSDTDSRKVTNTIAKIQSKSVKPKEKPMEIDSIPNNKDESTSTKIAQNLEETLGKPSTSKANVGDSVLLTSGSDQSGDVNDSAVEIKNPCLQNVSLFDEQFKAAKYNISESSDAEQQKKNEITEVKQVQEKPNEVVMLKSHTDSDTEGLSTPPKKKHRAGVATSKRDRDRALANVFGFSGASQSKRRRQLSRRRRTISQNTITHKNSESDSSEWTSESDDEVYVSPPRGRKNRHTKKYLKPHAGRILSLEEEGGLFVMYGKKIYPLVKDGKMVKNYLTYLPESESEEEQSYWKLKYEEEKKKADDLKKLLENAKDPHSRRSTSTAATVQPDPLRKSTCNYQPQEDPNNSGKEICLPDQDGKKEVTKANSSESIKIKFTTKNDQEIHLEGNWPQIHNVLEHVVHIFHKEPQPISEHKARPVVEPPSSSGISTPIVITSIKEPSVDPEVHEKVNKIENEIFKEIEERDKEEQVEPNGQEINVTKRKPGRPRKSSQSSTSQSPAKRQKTSDQQNREAEENSTDATTATNNENNVATDTTKRLSRTPRKLLNESLNANETKTIQTRRSKVRQETSNADNVDEEEEVRYMFPPKTRQSIKATAEKHSRDKPHKSTTQVTKIISSPDTTCPNSMESTLGYQDSDPSPMRNDIRKKKRMTVFDVKSKAISHLRRSVRKKTHPLLYCDDSRTLPVDVSIKKIERDNSTLNSEVYKSESYQLLMPLAKSSFRQLEQIDEATPIGNDIDSIEHLYSTSKNEVFSVQINTDCNTRYSGHINSDVGSSSNMSLPLSPELSMVESLSISKDLLNGIEHGPSINEMQCNDIIKDPANCRHYLMTNVDVSVPLMQQECGLESCNMLPNESDPKSLVTESLLSKIGTFNIGDGTNLTDTLDIKLRDLLLESAKKMAMENENKIDKMEVDDTNVEVLKKVKIRKRCSTPRKRKDSQKSKKIPKVQTVIEEEHIELYSQGGRKSCPPIIQALATENTVINEEINIADLTIDDNTKPKGRKKKDVIKVKIMRPKRRKSQTNTTKSIKESSKNSICTDSGINDTESGLFLPVNESVDLIHNHSETCLLANECVGDSVELVENSMKSVLSLGDSIQSCDNEWNSQYEFNDGENTSPDLFCNNAQDVRSFYKPNLDDIQSGSETVYHSPIGTELSSLVTEDLSDDAPQQPDRPNRWYLLSEDETTNTNMANAPVTSANVGSFGANLKQIFPMTYAVPDLSTITEMSRENDDNSRKPTLESLTGDGFNSQSIFDSNS